MHILSTTCRFRELFPMRPEIKNFTNLCMQEGHDDEGGGSEKFYQKYKEGNLVSDEVVLLVMYNMGWGKGYSDNESDSISG